MKTLKLKLQLTYLFALSGILISCVPSRIQNLEKNYTSVPASDKTLGIPYYGDDHQFNGYPYIYWNFCKQKEKQLGLKKPETSSDSLIFRMWITNPGQSTGQMHGLIEIRNDSTGWEGQLTLMIVNFNMRSLSETITKFETYEITPLKTDWTCVTDSLTALRIAELPTDDQIPDYYADGNGYASNETTFCFEYATPETYRFYQYTDIYRAPDRFWQAQYVLEICRLLEDEFQWDTKARTFFKIQKTRH